MRNLHSIAERPTVASGSPSRDNIADWVNTYFRAEDGGRRFLDDTGPFTVADVRRAYDRIVGEFRRPYQADPLVPDTTRPFVAWDDQAGTMSGYASMRLSERTMRDWEIAISGLRQMNYRPEQLGIALRCTRTQWAAIMSSLRPTQFTQTFGPEGTRPMFRGFPVYIDYP